MKISSRLLNAFFSLSLALFIICCAVKFTLAFRQLYYFDLTHLNIAENSGMNLSNETIKHNYDVLIDYNLNSKIEKLKFPDFAMSKQGEIHFQEVKALFTKINYLLYITAAFSLIGILMSIGKRNSFMLKLSSYLLISLPLALAVPFAVNFDRSFTVFHKIFFRNDYWEFDPNLDPIINVLPQNFFFHCALLILFIIVFFSILLFFLSKLLKAKTTYLN